MIPEMFGLFCCCFGVTVVELFTYFQRPSCLLLANTSSKLLSLVTHQPTFSKLLSLHKIHFPSGRKGPFTS